MLAKTFFDLKNIDCFKNVMTALSLFSIRRLKATWKALPSKVAKQFQTLEQSAADDVVQLQCTFEALSRSQGPLIPCIKSLVTCLANFNQLEFPSIRDRVLRTAAYVYAIGALQQSTYRYPAIHSVQNFLRRSGRLHEKELGQHSLFCEPDPGYKKELEKICTVRSSSALQPSPLMLDRTDSDAPVADGLLHRGPDLPRRGPAPPLHAGNPHPLAPRARGRRRRHRPHLQSRQGHDAAVQQVRR